VLNESGAPVGGVSVSVRTPDEELFDVTDSGGRYDVVLSSYSGGDVIQVSVDTGEFHGSASGVVSPVEGSTMVNVTVSQLVEFTYDLHQGWNLISLPLVNESIDAVNLSAMSSNIRYVVNYAAGKSYINGFSSAADNFALSPEKGYLVYMAAADSITVRGVRPSGLRSVELQQGYNLVGWTSMTPSTVTEAFVAPLAGKVKYVTKRDSDTIGYQTYIVGFSGPEEDFAVAPGSAYYVYVTEACTLSYTAD
jgi:hypothetical protein